MKPVYLLVAAITGAGLAGTAAPARDTADEMRETATPHPESVEGCPGDPLADLGEDWGGEELEMPDDDVHAGLAPHVDDGVSEDVPGGCPRDMWHRDHSTP